MIKTITVGISGSQHSHIAADLALRWCQHYKAAVTALGIVDLPQLAGPQPVPLGGDAFKAHRDQAIMEAAEREIAKLLADFQSRATQAGVTCQSVQLAGDARRLIVQEAQRADLLVLGKKSVPLDFGVESSQVLPYVLRHLPRPVVCAAADADPTAAALMAYDGSPQAAKALQVFVSLGLAEKRAIHVLTVASHAEEHDPGQDAAAYLTAHGYAPQILSLHSREAVSTVILEQAERLGVGLIVMGCYGRPRISEIFFGSVTQAVLHDTTRPVLLYH